MKEYIEREALLKKLCWEQCGRHEVCCDCCYDVSLIKDFPAADVAPVVHGRWVYEKTYQGMKYVCSECGEIPECFEPSYCPNCGARMDGE